jgi:hypothetical protein
MELELNELGTSGLKRQGGVVYEEYLTELKGASWHKVVREMEDEAIVGAMLFAVEMQTRQVTWDWKPANDSKSAKKWAEFAEGCMRDMSSTWDDTLAEIMTMLPYGHSVFELVYKIRNGDSKKSSERSKYNDGLIGWRKWSPRAQETISGWEFDNAGGISGAWQDDYYASNSKPVLLPIEKVLLFRTTSKKNNPNGRSVLRTAYRPYYFARQLANTQAIMYERLNGVPVGRVPAQIMSTAATAGQQTMYNDMKDVVVNLRVDEQAGLILPSDRDEHGEYRYDIDLLRADAGAGYDIEASIVRYEQRILMSIMADFIMIGHDSTGSFSLSTTKTDMFWTGVNAWLDSIAEVINRHALSRLMRANGVKQELWPTLVHGSVERVDLDTLGQYVVRAASSGIDFSMNPEAQAFLMQQANIPYDATAQDKPPIERAPSPAQSATVERNNGDLHGDASA